MQSATNTNDRRALTPEGIYIPTGAVKVTDKATGAWAYLYSTNRFGSAPTPERPAAYFCARTFTASKQRRRPVTSYRFNTEKARDAHVAEFFSGQRGHAERKAKAKAEAAAPHTLKVGDVLYSSWGYEQTNVAFYQVTDLVGKSSVHLCKIRGEMVTDEGVGPMSGRTRAVKDAFASGDTFTKRVSMYQGRPSVKIDRSETAWLDDGRSHYVSWYG